MSIWDTLAEARIKEWLERSPDQRESTSPVEDPTIPLEVQLAHDVAELDRRAARCTDEVERVTIMRKANETALRLMVVLEGQGRPLAAKHFAEQRRRNATND